MGEMLAPSAQVRMLQKGMLPVGQSLGDWHALASQRWLAPQMRPVCSVGPHCASVKM